MRIRKKLFQLIPPSVLEIYRIIKRIFKKHKFKTTGNNIAKVKGIHLNEALINEKKIDNVKVMRYLNWVNPLNSNELGKYQFLESEYKIENNYEIEVGFNNYGSWILEIQYCKGNRIVAKEKRTIKVEAPEYNIAYLSATLPAEIFLINLWNITSAKCPTIVGLERVLIDYNTLPKNVFPFPLASEEELNTAYKGFYSYSQRMVSYISMLYQMNPEAKFNLYLCDHQAYYTLAFFYSNRIPEKNFTVFLLSDGTGSYEGFNYVFGNPDRERVYKAMKDTWILAKQMAIESGVQDWKKESFIYCGRPSVSMTQKSDNHMIELSNRLAYAYVITRESQNFKWILHNPDLLDCGDSSHFPLTDSIEKIDFAEGIRNLGQHREELIRLLDLDYSVFERSHSNGKHICVLFGSYPPADIDMQYADATIDFFGKEEYDYYFKEHPHTRVTQKREKAVEERDIIFLNPKIPTEIYMMINADIYLAGYLSTSFLSIELLNKPEEQILSVWGVKKCHVKTSCLDFTAKTAMNIEDDTVVIYDR